jgi:hypothetical protein
MRYLFQRADGALVAVRRECVVHDGGVYYTLTPRRFERLIAHLRGAQSLMQTHNFASLAENQRDRAIDAFAVVVVSDLRPSQYRPGAPRSVWCVRFSVPSAVDCGAAVGTSFLYEPCAADLCLLASSLASHTRGPGSVQAALWAWPYEPMCALDQLDVFEPRAPLLGRSDRIACAMIGRVPSVATTTTTTSTERQRRLRARPRRSASGASLDALPDDVLALILSPLVHEALRRLDRPSTSLLAWRLVSTRAHRAVRALVATFVRVARAHGARVLAPGDDYGDDACWFACHVTHALRVDGSKALGAFASLSERDCASDATLERVFWTVRRGQLPRDRPPRASELRGWCPAPSPGPHCVRLSSAPCEPDASPVPRVRLVAWMLRAHGSRLRREGWSA